MSLAAFDTLIEKVEQLEGDPATLARVRTLFSSLEHAEALAVVLADPVDALTCFQAMVAEGVVP